MSSVEALRDIVRFLNSHEFSHDGESPHISDHEPHRRHSDDGPLHIIDNVIVASYATLLLGSSFQPIVTVDDLVIGHKALVVAKSPAHHDYRLIEFPENSKLTLATTDRKDVIYRDRLTRTMHTLNYVSTGQSEDLYLSVNPQHLQAVRQNHGEAFEKILTQCGLHPDRIVLEIPEYAVADKQHLRAAIAAWQQRNYRIAIDIGTVQTQLTSILSLKPDIVKFDGRLIARLSEASVSHKHLENMIERIHADGVHAVAAGVDSGALYDTARKYRFFALHGKWLTGAVSLDY